MGVIELGAADPTAALHVVFNHTLPFAVCPEVRPLPVPTGL